MPLRSRSLIAVIVCSYILQPKQGDEIVQLYIRQPVASVTRPVKELKGFARISLLLGEKKVVQFMLDATQLAFLDCSYEIYSIYSGAWND
ncbi:MAG: hypothetical protein DI539_27480 [Flavobacterium psychrophilum]|nr:MAG: hypothetical protein DI539_27480 [Flavobacterium psychrophilum]